MTVRASLKSQTLNASKRRFAQYLLRRHLPPEVGAHAVDEFATSVDDFRGHDLVLRRVVKDGNRNTPDPLTGDAPVRPVLENALGSIL